MPKIARKVPYIAVLLSILIHLVVLLLIILNYDVREKEPETTIIVNIISSPKQVVSSKHVKHHKHKIEVIKQVKQEDVVIVESEKEDTVIEDLSYSQNTYTIGSPENPIPPYPRIAKLRGYQGRVEICVVTDVQGKIIDASVHDSSGYSILDNAALKTVETWRLNIKNISTELEQSDDNKQYYRIIVPIRFELE